MSTIIEQLPTLGVGASLSLSSKPDPVSLVNSAGGPGFVEYAGLVDVDAVIDEVERVRAGGAADEILQGVEAGFQQLLSSGILKLA
jgi:hypothetical protein